MIFARNTIPHIIRGKAYARAVRGPFLIDAVLHTLFLSKLYAVTFDSKATVKIGDNTVQIYPLLLFQ